MFSKTQRLILGLVLLLLVDIIFVSSNEFTKILFEDAPFDKPFFCAYFKTSLFAVYLIFIGLITPWKESCEKHNGSYSMMDSNNDDDVYYAHSSSLSDPTFVPIRYGGNLSGTESEDSSPRSVRFSKLAEVREMSAHEANEALMARLSYAASMRIKRHKTHNKTAKTALLFCILWFLANYLLQLALASTEQKIIINCLSDISTTLCTLIFAAFFPSGSGDKATISKCFAVALQIVGVLTISVPDIREVSYSRSLVAALLSSIFYAAYLVFVKRKNDTEEKIDIALFFGFVGLWCLLFMWPIFFILHFLKVEKFELPTQNQFAILFLNGLIGTVFADAMWLWGCFLTSSLIGTMMLSLNIPFSYAFDLMLQRKIQVPPLFTEGFSLLVIAVLLVSFLLRNDDTDPLVRLFKISYRKLCSCHKTNVLRINDEEQQESLISSNND